MSQPSRQLAFGFAALELPDIIALEALKLETADYIRVSLPVCAFDIQGGADGTTRLVLVAVLPPLKLVKGAQFAPDPGAFVRAAVGGGAMFFPQTVSAVVRRSELPAEALAAFPQSASGESNAPAFDVPHIER